MFTWGIPSILQNPNRRSFLGVGVAGIGLAALGVRTARTQATKSATIVLGAANLDVSWQPNGPFAQQLGYFRQEGVDMSIETVPTTAQATQAVLAGKGDFAMVGVDSILQAADKGSLPLKMVYQLMPRSTYTLVVLPDSPINDFADLGGKIIGMPSLSTLLTAFVKIRMDRAGVTEAPKQVVEMGVGLNVMEALKDGTIDAYLGWPSLFAYFENAGYALKYLPYADWQKDFYNIGLVARNEFIEQNPDVVETLVRGLAKATVYVKTNQVKCVESFWTAYPERAPMAGQDREKELQNNLRILNSAVVSMRVDERPVDFKWGEQNADTWRRHYDLLRKLGVLKTEFDPAVFFTNQFNEKANDFDHAAIVKAASE
jgi:NitT/TauT family transport system substrate-binding protein